MLESTIKTNCKKQLRAWGWFVLHLIQTNENGIPDTEILRDGRAVFIEFKRPGEKPDPLQLFRHKQLRELGFEVYVVSSLSHIHFLR